MKVYVILTGLVCLGGGLAKVVVVVVVVIAALGDLDLDESLLVTFLPAPYSSPWFCLTFSLFLYPACGGFHKLATSNSVLFYF